MINVPFCRALGNFFLEIRFVFDSSSVNVGFGLIAVRILHRWNWKDISMVVICYGLTAVVSTS